MPPWQNGCDNRCKWPFFFLNENIKSNIKLFSEYNYEQYFFSNPNEKSIGLFPKEADNYEHNIDLDLRKFINKLDLKDKSHLFISIPDFHWILDDFGYNEFSEQIGYKKVNSSLDIIFDKFRPDYFDHIFIFSDHGFKFYSEINYAKRKNNLYLYNEDRIRCLLFHRTKSQKNIRINNKLLSLADMQNIYKIVLKNKNISNSLDSRNFVCFEDHLNFGYENFMETEIFGLIDKNSIYIRSFDKALQLDRLGNFISNRTSERKDKILKVETTFFNKINYFKKLPKQQKIIIQQNIYTNGSKRVRKLKIKNKILNLLKRIYKIFFN